MGLEKASCQLEDDLGFSAWMLKVITPYDALNREGLNEHIH